MQWTLHFDYFVLKCALKNTQRCKKASQKLMSSCLRGTLAHFTWLKNKERKKIVDLVSTSNFAAVALAVFL